MRNSVVMLSAFTLAAAAAAGTGTPYAQEEEATGVVAYRQNVMKASGDQMVALKALLVDGEGPMEMAPVHAQYFTDTAPHIVAMFPEGSDSSASWALPSVWEDREGFEQAAQNYERTAQAFAEAVQSGDQQQMVAAYAAMGRDGCEGCHEDYRKKDE